MCVIISVLKKKQDNTLSELLLNEIQQKTWANGDGVGIVCWNSVKNDFNVIRKMRIEKEEMRQILQKNDTIHIHLRQATTGVIALSNVHFWQKGPWLFAHNGSVQVYYDTEYWRWRARGEKQKIQLETDSKQFFDKLSKTALAEKEIDITKMQKLMNTTGFAGRGVLVHQPTKQTYYLGSFYRYKFNTATIISSCTLDLYYDCLKGVYCLSDKKLRRIAMPLTNKNSALLDFDYRYYAY